MIYIFYVMFGDSQATIRCSSYEEDELLDGYLRLNEVTGLNDNSHPDLNIRNIVIKRDKIVYYVIAEENIDDDSFEESSEEEEIEIRKPIKRRGRV